MTGVVEDFSWLGTHKVLIRATNGRENLAVGARGDKGLYRTVDSEVLEIEIINPCLTSIVNFDQNLELEDLAVPNGQKVVELISNGPTDSASVTYGNGYDKCGNLTYIWLDKENNFFENGWFSYNSTVVINDVDMFNMTLNSEPDGTVLRDYFTLVIKLEEYPTSVPASFDLMITYRECFPYDFSGPQIDDITLRVDEEGP